MAFRKTYDEILELIKRKLLEVAIARAIVRKSGIRSGSAGGGDGGGGALATGGDPWDVITKLSNTDFDVGWRKGGFGPDMAQKWNSGPPCNLRSLSFTRLRDSLLRSGVDNDSRFGYAFDVYKLILTDNTYFVRAGAWAEATPRPLFDVDSIPDVPGVIADPLTDDIIDVVKDQARIIAYVTKADFPYTFKLSLERYPALGTNPITYTIDRTGTGRFVSDWYNFPAYDPASQDSSFGTSRPYGDGFTTATIEATEDDPTVSASSYEELQEGIGPLCCPFFEIEVRTVYYAESSYWIQDEYTPEDYRIAQWEVD